MRLTLLDGSTFVVCDERGDLGADAPASGFFAADTRFLSRSVLTIDGQRGEPVSFEQRAPHVGVFDLRWPSGLEVRRELFVGRGLEETVTVSNRSEREVDAVLALELASDFADIFAVKRVEDLGAPGTSEVAPSRPEHWKDAGTVEFADDGFPARTLVHLAPPPDEADGGAATCRLRLAPGERVAARRRGAVDPERHPRARRRCVREVAPGGPARAGRVARGLAPVGARSSRRRASSGSSGCGQHSLADLAALRLRWAGSEMVPAAGLPWFMTLFGRDTLITSFQELLLGPGPAAAALRALADDQAEVDDPERDAEPGKIVHELRRGKTALVWTDRYYGTVDATPLFLVLLSELWRWSGDDAIVRELEQAARKALGWIDSYRRSRRRRLCRVPPPRDRTASTTRTGRTRGTRWSSTTARSRRRRSRRSRCRVTSTTRSCASPSWRAASGATRRPRRASSARRRELRDRFNDVFWLEERGWYALGLDRDKRPVDALASNMGHLLWSGIVPAERVAQVAQRLTSGPLWSGWGSARSPRTSRRSTRSSTTTAQSGPTTTR